ncbi:hypothetical protein [Novosphingobium aquimarinum]|uniref:hypothetical protein n=1 Tax=Novosphingobium aquimarinum TaxID=2682494 RepID=UPI0012EB8236|nr:hypothetical protein [Novosphingobium aquimarinum]
MTGIVPIGLEHRGGNPERTKVLQLMRKFRGPLPGGNAALKNRMAATKKGGIDRP